MPRLCSFGCSASDATLHSFPNKDKDPERFKMWVSLVGGKLETASDYQYYGKKKVCARHFTDQDRNRNNRLNALAVPSLHLLGIPPRQTDVANPPDVSETNERLNQPSILQPINTDIIQSNLEHSIIGPENFGQLPLSSTERSPNIATDATLLQSEQNYCAESLNRTRLAEKDKTPEAAIAIFNEHNYSAVTRNRKAGKSYAAYNCTQNSYTRMQLRNLRSEVCRLRKKIGTFKSRLDNATKLSDSSAFQKVMQQMTKPSQLFMHMQLQTPKRPKGRRYTIEEKILSLSLYKKSPKCYTLLYKYFTLPSARAMKRLLSKVKLCSGINPIIFEKIKKTILEKDIPDRLCSLAFDEMSLTPQVHYNAQKDTLEGFANNKENQFADHALVFMVKGLKQNFKQPIAYYFTSGLNRFELKQLIKTVVSHARASGLIIINTVCDQSTVNVGAITELVNETKSLYLRQGKEWQGDFFKVDGKKIIPLYDAPHLIKGIRNNLLTKDMIYYNNINEQKIVKWEYFQKVYAADQALGELKLLYKLTEEHINPEKYGKMRVKTATQIFSHSVAVVTEHLTARGRVPEECRQLIDITILLDNLFDSLNVNKLKITNGKIYQGPVKKSSPHHKLWIEAKKILKTVKFIHKKQTRDKVRLIETTVPSVTNLIKTIEGMEAIWEVLHKRYGYDAFLTRNLNQDPVENFFGNIRSYGARNNAPNTISFEGAFKALLLNNYNTPHSRRANCEEDTNDCLQNLDFFLKEDCPPTSDISEQEEIYLNEDVLVNSQEMQEDSGQRNYVCGWVLTKCLKNVCKSCKKCRQTILDVDGTNKKNDFIKAKEYNKKKWLCYPSVALDNCFQDLQKLTKSYLKKNVQKKNLKKNIINVSNLLITYPFNCTSHKEQLHKLFVNMTINIILYSWCRSINRILAGKVKRDENDVDEVKLAAETYYNKHKHYKNKK